MRRFIKLYLLFSIFLILQVLFWNNTRAILPDMSIVPNVPGKETLQALSLGDEESYFRLQALRIQNCGDTFGRFTALKLYDYKKLYQWFVLLDALDARSNMVPTMATYYFSQTQNVPDVRYVVDYLYQHAAPRVEKKWWWLVQAIYLAQHKLEDHDLALKLAKPLTTSKTIPVWAQEMPALVHEQRGEMDEAMQIIENIQSTVKDIPPGELNFMRYFVEERLKKLDELHKPQ